MNKKLLKNSIKTFSSNAVYIFIPMGIVYLFLLIGIIFFLTSFVSALSETLSSLSALISSSAQQSSTSVTEFISYTLDDLQGNGNILSIIRRIFDPEWISSTLRGFLGILDNTTEGFEENFTLIVSDFSEKLKAYVLVTLTTWSAGIFAADFLTGYALRRRTVKRNLKKILIAHTAVPLVQSIVMIAAIVVLSIIKLYGIVIFALILLLNGVVALTSSWLIHRDKTLSLSDVLTGENIIAEVLVILLLLLFNLVVAFILMIINPVLAVLIMIPLMIYSLKTIDVNTDLFICSEINNFQHAKRTFEYTKYHRR